MPLDHEPDEVLAVLKDFRDKYDDYAQRIMQRADDVAELRPALQSLMPTAAAHIAAVIGDMTLSRGGILPLRYNGVAGVIGSSLMGGNSAKRSNFAPLAETIQSWLNEAIDSIEGGSWPVESRSWLETDHSAPYLYLNSSELTLRCGDLLAAPGNHDRAIREATTVLEDKIRTSVPHEELSRRIPNPGDQTGEELVNELMTPGDAVIEVSSDRKKQAAFQTMCRGVFVYLRNDYHHRIDEDTDWAWAWSTVGLIDQLLAELGNARINAR